MKKVIALILALIMILSMGVVAFARTLDEVKITVIGSEKDVIYNFYKIFDLTGADNNTNDEKVNYDAIAYTIDPEWVAFFIDANTEDDVHPLGEGYIVDTNSGDLNIIVVNGAKKYINITESNVVEFTNAAMKYAIDNGIAVDVARQGSDDGSEIVIDKISETVSLPLGYYLMVPVDMTDEKAPSAGSIASLTTTVPAAEIEVKATRPSIEKTDDKVSADIGETVTYTITGTVPNTSGTNVFVYKISDTMSAGLTFKKDVKVFIDNVEIAEKELDADNNEVINYIIDDTTDANGFTCDIKVVNFQSYIGKEIKLTYTAVVNENAVANDQEKNTAKLEYGRNPDALEETTPIEEEVYTSKIVINKYAEDPATGPKLAKASFVLMNSEGKFYFYNETDKKVEWKTVTDGPAANVTADVTDAMISAIIGTNDITVKTTNSTGEAEFKGLKDGTYYLVETAAPNGYNRLDKAVEVTVTGNDVDTAEGKAENKADASGTYDSHNTPVADVLNQTGSVLPSTGGMGTTLFYVVGGALVVGAAVLLVTKKTHVQR